MSRLSFILIAALALSAGMARAADCPAPPDHSDQLEGLFAQISAAENDMDAREISNQMWELWTDAPDEAAQALLDRGMRARSGYDFLGALDALDRLVEYCPDYAEGYNQRAFVNFLRHDFPAALVDLNRTLELSPRHVGALSGKALTLMGMGELDEARAVLTAALALNPWLSERHLAAPGGPLAPVGEDL
ncbi:tetratricopeptide repeat protein [Aestuariivita boseongensis]|uniref:tetratricopeptide repeat protein n=1 Tax=Aestuariivita boseongensis TaxID=1470562 RepID=UPI0006816A18|nr:tetratricopeptide repeat protein [Aestuariivita boseongensis]